MDNTQSINKLKKDKRNANRGTAEGDELLDNSFRKYGAGRSVLADKDLNLIAGNHAFDKAKANGIKEIIIVPTDGTQLVVVQRTDVTLDSKKGREMALLDNTTAKVGIDLDMDVVEELNNDFGLEIDTLGIDISAETFDYDEDEDNDEGGEGSGAGKSKSDVPIIIIETTKSQIKYWERFKKEHGFGSDAEAFIKIFNHAKNTYGKE